ncbi:MAG TPA: TetR/AcrR family transcriptional regulator [Nocardioides sp.]|nr:TetR/AcrR family transcriptional regulator [Nocardioides sp.]
MTSLRHNTVPDAGPDTRPTADDALLDAARAAILAVGWRRTTLTDIARRAGVSRMTIYRRWPDMQTLLADLMTREWSGVVEDAALDDAATVRDRLVGGVVATVRALRSNELFLKIVEVDPELLLPYLLDRRGRTQDAILGLVEAALVEGQAEGSVRSGDPVLLARSVVLTCHGFALSTQTMTGSATGAATSGPAESDLEDQLRALVDRYLRP